jgi:hypothetical protein
MKILYTLLILILLSCSGGRKGNNETSKINPLDLQTIEDKQETETIGLLDNGLMSTLTGDWITTILTDSIPKKREIFRWKNYFLGNLMISIKENDTLIISGEWFRDKLNYEVINSKTLVLPERDNFKIVYSPENDLIYLGRETFGSVYKRSTIKSFEKIASDKNLLMNFVINLLFKCDYLPNDFASKIKYVALDLETYNRFTFDAIGLENEIGEIEYYGWKFIGDTLNLYRTSSIYDGDSGFTFYKIEEINKQYFKNN